MGQWQEDTLQNLTTLLRGTSLRIFSLWQFGLE